ncbi:putative PPE family protein PPE2 [Mycobacterium talmoniae]|uniref:Putative PPE family protein PPE2 n=1 Tax=Mycobacterium talmoniae TaxID=1858794 RepID=A0A2S8BKW2_9MYCO|nr:putative PPE family protein PPE2 [Mycobacterium talmoniae]
MVGPPGIGFGAPMSLSAAIKARASEPESAAAAAAASAAKQARRRRRRTGLTDLGHRYEYLDASAGGGERVAAVTASAQGAGTLGFAGTAHKAGAEHAAGLTTLTDDSLESGPRMPMMPSSWATDIEEPPPGDDG